MGKVLIGGEKQRQSKAMIRTARARRGATLNGRVLKRISQEQKSKGVVSTRIEKKSKGRVRQRLDLQRQGTEGSRF